VVRADLQSLVPPHDQSGLMVLPVLQQSDVSSSTLLPLPRVTVESKQLGSHLESDFLLLFVGLDFDLFGKVDDRGELDIDFLLGVLLRSQLATDAHA
jgi:hypothetical protein